MSDQIDGLLTLSRISRAKLDLKRIDLSDLAFVIVGNLRDNEPDRKVHIEIEKEIEVVGDERMLMSLMQNLIENAWKFTSTVPRAKIHIYKQTHQGCKVSVVEDNGVGFDMAYSDKLFGVFQRLHSSSEFPGTGIGLATAFRIVQRHDGLIWAESEPGKGSKFMFTIGCKEDGVLP
jgi:light-regulated signal transduction histidine kinase (bacteriophytochrome)